MGARGAEQKKGADKGIDGRLFFKFGPDDKFKHIVISVKAGKLKAEYVRDLRGVREREKAEIGALLSFEPFTQKSGRRPRARDSMNLPGASTPAFSSSPLPIC